VHAGVILLTWPDLDQVRERELDPTFRTEPHFGSDSPDIAISAEDTAERRYPIEFTAMAGEYFRIWIVNLVLTVLTLGIYSAWAAVRKRRYFYGHTKIDGESFEYRGNPVAILKGRLIAAGIFAIISLVSRFYPGAQFLFLIVGVFVFPWLLVRSLAFNAYNSAYRNIRLHFRGSYGRCLGLVAGYALLIIVTLGFAYPYLRARLVQFAAGNHYYGTTRFTVADLGGKFFSLYLRAAGLLILIVLLAILLLAGSLAAAMLHWGEVVKDPAVFVFVIVIYLGYLVAFAYLRARVGNATWNGIAIGPVHFVSALRVRDIFRLYLVNILATIVTLGLAVPWAVVRTMRYRAARTTLIAADGLEHFVGAESAQVSATGEEVGEMFDLDFGF
jgi:uncharacterized membrane protein YjgN (DUF898 family)